MSPGDEQTRRTEDQCPSCLSIKTSIAGHEKKLDANREDHADMWNSIKDLDRQKVSYRLFALLVLLIIGNLGFQLAIFTAVKETEIAVAVIETEFKLKGKEKGR